MEEELWVSQELSLGVPPELTTEILSHLNFPHLKVVFCVCRFWASYDADFFYLILLEKNHLQLGTPCPSRPLRWVFQSKFSIPEDQIEDFTGIGSAPFFDVGNYEGDWKDGSMHGWGTFFYKTSDGEYNVRYDGEWHEGARQGKGRMVWGKDGPVDVYEGTFANNLFDGEGTFRWRTGDKYVGNWKENKRSGFGTFHWNAGDSYEGLWEDDLKSGEGTLRWHNGNEYQGSWKNELKEKGRMFEAVSKRTFQADEIDYVIKPANLHPLILQSTQLGICTSTATQQTCYFQYLWQTTESTDRIHGVCIVCKDKCVIRNGYKLRNPAQFYFGGNFFCDCGTGRLGGVCYAHTVQ